VLQVSPLKRKHCKIFIAQCLSQAHRSIKGVRIRESSYERFAIVSVGEGLGASEIRNRFAGNGESAHIYQKVSIQDVKDEVAPSIGQPFRSASAPIYMSSDLKVKDFARSTNPDARNSIQGSSIGKREMQSPHRLPELKVTLHNLSSSANSENLREALCALGVPSDA
jgi:hypothetical protein